jgi:hypothetical protein
MRLFHELGRALMDAGSMTWQITERAARVTGTGITWNYTTILNIIFLLIAAALVMRFVRSGSAPMLKVMGGSPAQQSLQTQLSDQNRIAVPSAGMAPASTVRSRD